MKDSSLPAPQPINSQIISGPYQVFQTSAGPVFVPMVQPAMCKCCLMKQHNISSIPTASSAISSSTTSSLVKEDSNNRIILKKKPLLSSHNSDKGDQCFQQAERSAFLEKAES